MRLINKLSLGIAAVAVLTVGCTAANQSISEESLGLRKTDLYSESTTVGDETKYGKAVAGTSKTISRAFQDAPPMIPHDVDGMLPITIKDNQCVSCHAPEVATSMGALPYPSSHMMDFRPSTAIAQDGRISFNGEAVDNTSHAKLSDVSIKKLGKLSGTRFNCSQCHAPQSEGQLVENTFEADFTSKDGANKSSWDGGSLMDGIDTLAN
ncbi:MAG: nitrate reductase cytochrome c-type subunit [Campylobacterota bacterium]|nr:nitrate reductase cytochrome c-type subunit [Campylobacterota bacterium]